MGARMLAVAIAAAVVGTGCSSAKVYSDPAVTRYGAVPVFPGRKVLVPTKTAPDGHVLSYGYATVPDTSSPVYLQQLDGLGSGGFGIECSGGVLTKYTQKPVGPAPKDVIDKTAGAAVTVLGVEEILRELDVLENK